MNAVKPQTLNPWSYSVCSKKINQGACGAFSNRAWLQKTCNSKKIMLAGQLAVSASTAVLFPTQSRSACATVNPVHWGLTLEDNSVS